MEKLWSLTRLGTGVFDVCVFLTTAHCSPSFPPRPPCLSHTARFDCFVFQLLNVSENAHTRSHPHAHKCICTHSLHDKCRLGPVIQPSGCTQSLKQICYICAAAWLQHLLRPSAKRRSIRLGRGGEQYYLHQFSPWRWEFPANGQLSFLLPLPCFNSYFSKWPPFSRTDETSIHMLINSTARYAKKKKKC